MKLSRNNSLYIPEPTASWRFNVPSGTVFDTRGKAPLSIFGGVYNGSSITVDQNNSANYWKAPVGCFEGHEKFSVYIKFKLNDIREYTDIVSCSNGNGQSSGEFLWYFDVNYTQLLLGIATPSSYGVQNAINVPDLDTNTVYHALFGYRAGPHNYSFFYLNRDDGTDIMSNHVEGMDSIQMGTSGYHIASRGDHTTGVGSSVSVDYHRLGYWANAYLDNPDILRALKRRA